MSKSRNTSNVVVLNSDVDRDLELRADTVYVVTARVRVRPGIAVRAQNHVRILIQNGTMKNCLIFESGSRLFAKTLHVDGCDDPCLHTTAPMTATRANNGGLFFCGTYRRGTKDGVSNDISTGRSFFKADTMLCQYLGRTDVVQTAHVVRVKRGEVIDDDDADANEDVDGISVIGVGQTEWKIKRVTSSFSGDDGFDVTNSSITLDALDVHNPIEDCLNVSSSFIQIRLLMRLIANANKDRTTDRELFDLEIDDGQSRVLLNRNCHVDVDGTWGQLRDNVSLNSLDMPQPSKFTRSRYVFKGKLVKGPSIVYRIQ